ncbi:cyclophilin-like fold protein [Kineococcus sp. TBRC 1896]|uniref:Cyclophilin-like fold protein n=1 Tax=Kineococcus mangrovi TaxID=1660183 RepID=A0ABV4I6V5_9ACTN
MTAPVDIRITTTEGTPLAATLNDSAAARDFAAMLPLTLTLADFHATEKVADLPGRLSTDGSPDAAAATAGDIAYYAPWGNLALFYRDFPRSAGLVVLGHVSDPLDALVEGEGRPTVTIEAVPAAG